MRAKFAEVLIAESVTTGELEIDDMGRVWRTACRRGGRGRDPITIPCQKRRAENSTGEYLQVRLMLSGVRHHALAHRLVWHCLRGPIPEGMVINHKNGDKLDNRPENLEVVTYSENSAHAVRVLGVGTTSRQWGEANPQARLTTEHVAEIRRRRAAGEKLLPLAQEFGTNLQHISRIVRGDRRSRG